MVPHHFDTVKEGCWTEKKLTFSWFEKYRPRVSFLFLLQCALESCGMITRYGIHLMTGTEGWTLKYVFVLQSAVMTADDKELDLLLKATISISKRLLLMHVPTRPSGERLDV